MTPEFRKLPECDRCFYYTSDPLLSCAVHPLGVEGDDCNSFEEDSAVVLDWQLQEADYQSATRAIAQALQQRWQEIDWQMRELK